MKGDGAVSKQRLAPAVRHTVQSAALPYRWTREGPRVLLVTSRVTRRWVLPKGSVKTGLDPAASAMLEAFEEGGISGRMSRRCIGVYGYAKKNGRRGQLCLVQVFPLWVIRLSPDWPERRQRRREWTTFAMASARVHEPALKRILRGFEQRLLVADRPSLPSKR